MTDAGTSGTESPNASVIFVREWEQQLSSSGCCGRVEGDFLDFGSEARSEPAGETSSEAEPGGLERERVFSERRARMEEVGTLYRAIRDRYGDAVDIRVVDPRNLLSLVPIFLKEGRRHGVPLRQRLQGLLRLSVNMVIVNGEILSRNGWPSRSDLLERLEADGGATGAGAPGGRAAPAGSETSVGSTPLSDSSSRA